MQQRILASFDPTNNKPFNIDFHNGKNVIQGKGRTWEDAILDLAAMIKDSRASIVTKTVIPRIDVSKWRHDFEQSLKEMQEREVWAPYPGNFDYAKWRESVNAASAPEQPSVGRIVWYYPVTGEIEGCKYGPIPGIITKIVDQDRVNIRLFVEDGDRFVTSVDYHKDARFGCWNWPKK